MRDSEGDLAASKESSTISPNRRNLLDWAQAGGLIMGNTALPTTGFLASASPDLREMLESQASEIQLESGESLFEQGMDGDALYAVLRRYAPTKIVGDAVAPRDAMMAFREGDRAGRTI